MSKNDNQRENISKKKIRKWAIKKMSKKDLEIENKKEIQRKISKREKTENEQEIY